MQVCNEKFSATTPTWLVFICKATKFRIFSLDAMVSKCIPSDNNWNKTHSTHQSASVLQHFCRQLRRDVTVDWGFRPESSLNWSINLQYVHAVLPDFVSDLPLQLDLHVTSYSNLKQYLYFLLWHLYESTSSDLG